MAGAIFTASQCQRLKEHKYNPEGRSLVEPLLHPFWMWLTGKMPTWLAPNAFTLTGLIVNVVSSSVVMYHCPTATEEPVAWTLILCAVCLFAYQTLDAVDGKQAKRLNQDSPLEEMFDHGCDAVSSLFVSLSLTSSLKLGLNPGHFFLMNLNSLVTFYLAHWQGYVSGKLKFGKFDVTEVQLLCITVLSLVALTGTNLLSIKLLELPYFGDVVLWQGALYSLYFISIGNMTLQFKRIMAGGVGKNGSSVADTSVLSPAIPLGLVTLSAFYIFKHSTYQIFQREANLAMMVFGICIAKLTWKLLIASMSKDQVDMTDISMLGPFALVLINYFAVPVSEYHVLVFGVIFECMDFTWYSIRVCRELSECLNLNVFTITPRRD